MTTTRKDELTRKITAFGDYAELTEACKGGYVPTLQTRGGITARARLFDANVRELRNALVVDGYSVWGGYSHTAPYRF